MKSIAEEYLRLGPLQTRILIHQQYSEVDHDVELDAIEAAGLGTGDALLDVGCGTGAFLARLRAQHHTGRLCGLDSSPAAVAAATAISEVTATLGNAEALPYGDGEFDVVTARHMLYHVDDPVAAIREAHRVLRPGGRFVATVNHAESAPRIADVVRNQAVEHGIEPPVLPISRVNSDNLPNLIQGVFATVAVSRHDNALIFREPEPAIRFALAQLNFYGVADDSVEREGVVRGVITQVEQWFAANEGPWRDPKGYIVCVSTRESL
jgi:SAM-dependent methyltransferase